jgi:hypothetical protein
LTTVLGRLCGLGRRRVGKIHSCALSRVQWFRIDPRPFECARPSPLDFRLPALIANDLREGAAPGGRKRVRAGCFSFFDGAVHHPGVDVRSAKLAPLPQPQCHTEC